MPVSSLKTVITGSFISALSKTGGSGQSPAPALGAKAGSGEALDVTLRSAARNMAVGVQSLNLGISYVNVSRDVNSKLLGLVDVREGGSTDRIEQALGAGLGGSQLGKQGPDPCLPALPCEEPRPDRAPERCADLRQVRPAAAGRRTGCARRSRVRCAARRFGPARGG